MTSVVFVTKNLFNPAYAGARLGADRTAHREGLKVSHRVPPGHDRVEDQLAILDDLLASPPDAVILHPYDDPRVDERLRRLHGRGVPVALVVNKPSDVPYVCFVGSDDVELARSVASSLCEHLNGRGEIVILDGHANALSTPLRGRGFREAVARWPDIHLLAAEAGDYRRDRSLDVMREILSREQRVDGVLAANDVSALGAIDALAEAGRSAAVIGINGSPDAVSAIRTGALLASAGFNAMAIACIATEAIARLLRGEPIPHEIILPVEIVTSANFGPWDKPYEARESPDWTRVLLHQRAAVEQVPS